MATRIPDRNIDADLVAGFGDEWTRFDQSAASPTELEEMAQSYFLVFPWQSLPAEASGFDLGCGSGRWAKVVAPRVGTLHCVDPSDAVLAVARRNLAGLNNVQFHLGAADHLPFAEASQDFGYALGVLHHLPDPAAGLRRAVASLKTGAPLLIYLLLCVRRPSPLVSRTPAGVGSAPASDLARPPSGRYAASQVLALLVYLPLARLARLLEGIGMNGSSFPLTAYRNRSFYVMRTDALDRFGTRLEHRFIRAEIREMMTAAGLRDVTFMMASRSGARSATSSDGTASFRLKPAQGMKSRLASFIIASCEFFTFLIQRHWSFLSTPHRCSALRPA